MFSVALLVLGACGATLAESPLPAPVLPENAMPVPMVRQSTTYSCGAAALQGVLAYWKVFDGRESSLYGPLETNEEHGTEPPKIIEVARSYGLEAELREGLNLEDLEKALAENWTVILNLQAWRDGTPTTPWKDTWEDGHYVVLIAMDDHYLYVMDPSCLGSYAYLPRIEFVDRWHDYENRHGPRREYHHLGMFFRGKQGLREAPQALIRLE